MFILTNNCVDLVFDKAKNRDIRYKKTVPMNMGKVCGDQGNRKLLSEQYWIS